MWKNKDKINKGEHRSKKAAPHNILQPETPKGMGQNTHTQTNRGRTHWKNKKNNECPTNHLGK